MNKICTKCKIEKPAEEFYKARKTELHSWCKLCNNQNALERYQNFKKELVIYKGGKCVDCGLEDDPRIYDFHRLDPTAKDFTISGKSNTKVNDEIKSELDKCVLLCSNCHRRRHFKILIKE